MPHRFDVLQDSQVCFTCTVGLKISKAQYYVEDTNAVLAVMQVRSRVLEPEERRPPRERERVAAAFLVESFARFFDSSPNVLTFEGYSLGQTTEHGCYLTVSSRVWRTCLNRSCRGSENQGMIVERFTSPTSHLVEEVLPFVPWVFDTFPHVARGTQAKYRVEYRLVLKTLVTRVFSDVDPLVTLVTRCFQMSMLWLLWLLGCFQILFRFCYSVYSGYSVIFQNVFLSTRDFLDFACHDCPRYSNILNVLVVATAPPVERMKRPPINWAHISCMKDYKYLRVRILCI